MNARPLAALAGAALLLSVPVQAAPPVEAVLTTYADIAAAGYADAHEAAKELQAAVAALLAAPGEATLAEARRAWIDARPSYQQTEVFRFGNPIVDAWEGRVNSWPLDEGLIDYVAPAYGTRSDDNDFYALNVVANPRFTAGGIEVDASVITAELLRDRLHEIGGAEANVATGYHAIEFLLWGQDRNGTGPGAGDRPFTDYSVTACTNGNCDRRGAYLRVAVDLLVADLAEMAANWAPGGPARVALMADPTDGLRAIFAGMGSLSYGELAGERMKLGLLLHDPEEEHDCFSDNTFNSHHDDARGIHNVYVGRYVRRDGSVVDGPSPADLVAAAAADLNEDLLDRLDDTLAAMAALKRRGETVEAYDQMIGEGNAEGNAVVQAAIDALVAQTRAIERAIVALEIGDVAIEGSDSLDSADAVFR